MGPLHMQYRECLIGLRNFINAELDSKTPNPEKFVKKFADKAEQVKSKAYVLIREGEADR